MSRPASRDEILDITRGFAMVSIAISHVGYVARELGFQGWFVPTLSDIGYSSAAELFVFLSGYMVGLVYLGRPDTTRRLLQRCVVIYKYNFVAFLSVMALAFLFGSRLADVTGTSFTLENPLRGVALFAALLQQPFLLDVLPLYMVLMVAATIFCVLLRINTILALLCSAALYLVAQFIPDLHVVVLWKLAPWAFFPGYSSVRFIKIFNPFAWQFLFFLALVAGQGRIHERLAATLRAHWFAPVAAIALFVGATVIYLLDQHGVIPHIPSNRVGLQPVRIAHTIIALSMLYAVCVLLGNHLQSRGFAAFFSALKRIGRGTLLCYTASIPATYLAGEVWLRTSLTQTTYLLGVALVLVLVYAVSGMRLSPLSRSGT